MNATDPINRPKQATQAAYFLLAANLTSACALLWSPIKLILNPAYTGSIWFIGLGLAPLLIAVFGFMLMLKGANRGRDWMAVLSITAIAQAVRNTEFIFSVLLLLPIGYGLYLSYTSPGRDWLQHSDTIRLLDKSEKVP